MQLISENVINIVRRPVTAYKYQLVFVRGMSTERFGRKTRTC